MKLDMLKGISADIRDVHVTSSARRSRRPPQTGPDLAVAMMSCCEFYFARTNLAKSLGVLNDGVAHFVGRSPAFRVYVNIMTSTIPQVVSNVHPTA